MAKYKVRLLEKNGSIETKVVNVNGFLLPRLLRDDKLYVYKKRDAGGVPYYHKLCNLWRVK